MSELSQAIRRHWSIETDNYLRDVTLNEDKVRTQKGNRTRAEATIRTVALEWLKIENPKSFQAAIETFIDNKQKRIQFLKKHQFIG